MRRCQAQEGLLLKMLCYAAARAALAQRSDAAVAASCAALGELCAAATSSTSVSADNKTEVMDLISQCALADVFCEADGAELQAVLSALHSGMGWSQQQAAAALLGLGLQQAQPTASTLPNVTASGTLVLCAGPQTGMQKGQAARLALLRTTGQHIEAVAGMLR